MFISASLIMLNTSSCSDPSMEKAKALEKRLDSSNEIFEKNIHEAEAKLKAGLDSSDMDTVRYPYKIRVKKIINILDSLKLPEH